MNSSDFTLKIIAALNKQLSKQQVKSDLKTMDSSMYVKVISKLSKTLSQRQLKKDLKQLNDLYVQIGTNVKVDKKTKNQLQKRIKELENSIAAIDVGLKVSRSKINSEISAVRKTVQAKAGKTPIAFDIEVKRSKAIADIEYLGKRFSKLFTNISAKQKYENILMSAYSISDESQLRSVRNQIAAFTSELKANDLASQSLGDKWKGLIAKSKELFSAASIVTAIFSQVKQSVSTFLQLDTAMTNLYKVQDQITSRDQFSGLLSKWNKLAQNLAVTTESLINSAAEWSKIGFDLDMSEQLAQITSIFEKTAEISNEKASSTLISAAQAFTEIDDLGVDDYVKRVEAVGNKINAIGNKYSIDSEGIADGLQNASAALKVAGNDLNETIALITTTNKIYQDPSESSNMLKVASMRLRGQVDALKELGEDTEGVSTDLTKIQQQIYELTGNKVNIFEDDENLKSTYQMVLEIGEVFNSLNDRQQADLLETMFGKQRASAGASLLLNYEELEKIKSDSMNAANSMAEEYSKYLESAEAHITIFKEKLVETYSAFMNGDLIKYTADVGSGLLDLVNSTDLLKHSMLAVFALNIGKGVSSVGAAIASTSKQMNTLGSALQQVKNLPLDDILRENVLKDVGEATKDLTEKNLKLLLSQKQLNENDKVAILTKHDLTKEETKAKLEKMGLITATKAQTTANVAEVATTTTLKGAMMSLKASIVGVGTSIKAVFLSNPIGVALTVITTAISIATAAMNKYNEKFERQQEKLDDALSAYENVKSELDSINSELDENKKKISELEAKPKLTYAEKGQLEELKQITEQLELQKEITEWQTGNKQKDAAMESVAYVNMKYNLGDSNVKDVDGLVPNILSSDHRSFDISEDIDVTDAEYLAAAYKSASNELSGLIDKRKELSNDSQDTVFVDNDIEAYKSSVEEVKTEINDMLSSLMEQKANIQDYYDTIKDTPYEDMSTDARKCYDAMQQIDASIQTLYYGLGNNRLNSEVIDGIFNTEGIEKTKEQLVEMAQAGTLSPSVIASHEKLADAILSSNLIADEGCGLFETLCNEVYALADAEKEAADSAKKMSESFSKSAMIDSLNALSDGFDIIDKIYADVKDKDVFDFANLDTKKFQEAFGELGVEYENFIEKVSESANDINACQQAFNELVSRYLEASGILDNLNEENAKVTASMLELMGVSNAQELVDDALLRKKAELIVATDAYKNATDEEKQAMLEEIGTGEALEQIIAQITLQKQFANANALDTTNDINAIYSLAQTAGFGAEALYNLAEARAFLMEAEASGDVDQINEAKEAIRRIVSVEQQKLASFTADLQYTGADTSNKKSGRSSSSSEKDLWLEEYKRKLEELKRQLNEGLITQKDFYYQSEALMNEYLKDSPTHLAKYAEEISDAENTLHDEWIKTLEYEKSELEKNVSDNVLVQWQYYEQLSELAEEYYNTAGASYGKFADEYDEITREIKEGQKKLWEDVFSELNTQIDDLQSACSTVKDAVKEYSENQSLSIDTVQKLIDLEPQYLAMLLDENGQLQLNEEAYAKLAKAKLEEMKVDLAYQALNTINGLENEAQAVELLTGKYAELRDTSLGAVEAMLQVAVAEAHECGEKQGQAADMMMQVYQNQKKVIDMADFSIPSLTGEGKEKEEKKFLKQFDWFGTLLEKISDKTSKLIDKVDKFYNWQKKNAMINRAVKSTDREISQNERAYQAYMKKANSVGLGLNYVRKIQNGALSIEDITDEKLADKIDDYQELYDKAQACLDTIEDLYDRQRDLIKQKLDNVLDYYSDMSSYLSSITSKIESVISLNDEMGKRSSLTELVEQFASISDQLEAVTTKDIAGITITEGSLGDSKKVADAVNRDRQELTDSIQSKIDNLNVKESGTYTKLLNNIAKTQVEIDKYKDKGWDKSKAKSYEKLQQKLRNYYDLQKALDENATSDTIANYEKTYTAYQKLQNKIDRGQQLSKSEQKRFDTYTKQLEDLRAQGKSALDKLYGELAEADGTAPKQSESDRIKDEIAEIQSDLENTATYQNLLKSIETVQNKIAELDEKGYENLTGRQKKTYDKLRVQLEDYYEQKQALDENATASNIAEYNKIYLAWKKLQDKLDEGKNLSGGQWKKYNSYTKQLEDFADEKADTVSKLNDALEEALNPSDRLEQIQKTYEESAEETYNSYQSQIDSIKGEAENTKQYQNLLAKAQKLEQKKDTKGLSKSEQAKLDKYNKELEALQTGATGSNITDYVKTWESWYKLQQKLDNGKNLSANEAKKYDTYKSQLEAWNEEKQTQINDLLSQMEDDLEQLQKTYEENVSGAESEVNDYYANLYSLAKQIAEYNITSLQTQLDYLDAYISYYKELVSLYDSFSGDKLTKILTDLDENALTEKAEVYQKYLDTLQDKYDTTLSEMNEYSQLLDALDTNDFEASMELFNKALEGYRESGDTAMADKLQSVLDLLNERAVDADNWGEFADQWAEECEKEFAAAKQELIGTATEIQNVNDALRQIKLDSISDVINELDTAKGLLSSIADLINDEWLYESNGELSEYGRAKVALLVSQLEDSQKKANAYLDLINEIQNNEDTYASDKAYMEDLNNATQNYYNTLGETASLENSIVEIMKKSAEEEVNSIKKIIDARKQALQKKKEYYDYNKSLKNSQKEIDSIKAQIDAINALGNTTDAATKAKRAQLEEQLAEKEDALQETKDEHTYNLQIDALDEFAKSLEDALDSSTKSVEEILKEQTDIISSAKDLYQTSTDSVNDTMDKIIAFYAGIGTSIDGLDLIPNGTGTDDVSIPVADMPTAGDSMVTDAVSKITDAVIGITDVTENPDSVADVSDLQEMDTLENISENTSKTAEILEKYGFEPISPDKLWENFNAQPFDFTQTRLQMMADAVQKIPDYIKGRDVQSMQSNINIHYDNLINVEGSVDKSFSGQFKNDSEKLYKDFTNRLSKDLQHNGVNFVRRPTLPTVK